MRQTTQVMFAEEILTQSVPVGLVVGIVAGHLGGGRIREKSPGGSLLPDGVEWHSCLMGGVHPKNMEIFLEWLKV